MQAAQGPDGAKAATQNEGQNLSAITILFKNLINVCNVVSKGLNPSELENVDLPAKVVLTTGARLDDMLSQTCNARTCLANGVISERISRFCHTKVLQQLRDLYKISDTSRSGVEQC